MHLTLAVHDRRKRADARQLHRLPLVMEVNQGVMDFVQNHVHLAAIETGVPGQLIDKVVYLSGLSQLQARTIRLDGTEQLSHFLFPPLKFVFPGRIFSFPLRKLIFLDEKIISPVKEG